MSGRERLVVFRPPGGMAKGFCAVWEAACDDGLPRHAGAPPRSRG